MTDRGVTMMAMSKRRGPWLWQLRRYEVFVRFGMDDEQGIPSGGAEWIGMYFTERGARRVYNRQWIRPSQPLPQYVEILKIPRGRAYPLKELVAWRPL